MQIRKIAAREVLDSRGNPTVEAEVFLDGLVRGRAIAPSGASTGEKEAVELRDNNPKRYNGKGVLKAVQNVNTIIAKHFTDKMLDTQNEFDTELIKLDGTPDKSKLGANAMIAVSMAFAKANSDFRIMPLYQYLNRHYPHSLPVPCMNVINGGKHADNNVDFQEFMIAPHNAPNFKESIRMGEETFHALKSILKQNGYYTGVGDEGGFAPDLKSNEEAVEVILEAITKAGYQPGTDISICLDPATSEMWENGKYRFFKSSNELISPEQLLKIWESWVKQYPIILIEDGMGEHDWNGWLDMTYALGKKIELVGDDIFCTNSAILQKGIDEGIANSVLIKLNQIGTVMETIDTIELAKSNGYNCFISHRSGETEDTTIADLAVATNAGHIKTGSGCRGERTAKFNQLLRIEEELGKYSVFAGLESFKNQKQKDEKRKKKKANQEL
ncbi:MAG: phosphopyruvate hydratase [Chitinophagales bacterium]|nr:phosphopyruvate hydratase [Chitinophagales bacterium]